MVDSAENLIYDEDDVVCLPKTNVNIVEQRENDNFDWDKSFEEWFLDYFDNHYDPKVNEMRLVRWLVLDVPE